MKKMRSRGLKRSYPFSVPKIYNPVKRKEKLYMNNIHYY